MSLVHPKYIGSLVKIVKMDDDLDNDVKIIIDREHWYDLIDVERWWAQDATEPEIHWIPPGVTGTLVDTAWGILPGVSLHWCKVLLPDVGTDYVDQFGMGYVRVKAGMYWVHMDAIEIVEGV